MHPRNRLFVTLALVYGLAGGLLALVRLAAPQLACANAGIALFALGLPFAGGALLWLSLALFTVRLWPVLRPLTRH